MPCRTSQLCPGSAVLMQMICAWAPLSNHVPIGLTGACTLDNPAHIGRQKPEDQKWNCGSDAVLPSMADGQSSLHCAQTIQR